MQHKAKLTVIDKKLYPELQGKYLADPQSGPCPFYNIGDEFVFERYGGADDFWQMGRGSQCSEAWDAISRYIYTALQGGSIMRNWTNDERMMIACCSDGTRPVIFKIERLDYKALYIKGVSGEADKVRDALGKIEGVTGVEFKPDFTEVYLDFDVPDNVLIQAAEAVGGVQVSRIE